MESGRAIDIKTEPFLITNGGSQRNSSQSSFQSSFTQFVQKREPETNEVLSLTASTQTRTPELTPEITPEHILLAHKKYLPNRFNSVECALKTNSKKPPYITHNFRMPVVSNGSTPMALLNLLMNVAHHEINNPAPKYMDSDSFNFCLANLKLTMNQKAFTTIDVDITIPHEVKLMLSYGPKFALPLTLTRERSQMLFNAINALNNFHLAVYECRTLIAMAKQHIANMEQIQSNVSNISQLFYTHIYNCTIRFFTENQYLMMAQADKGKISIIIPKESYIRKMHAHVNDSSVYNPINVTNHASLQRINEKILYQLAQHNLIRHCDIATILSNEQKIANLYGLIKIHKETHPTRPIVNTRAAPGYAIAKILSGLITPAKENYKYNVINSTDFLQRLQNVDMEPTDKIATLDIKNMFTNISTDMALKSIRTRYKNHKIPNSIPLELLIEALIFVTQTSTEIEFNKQLFKQKMGLRMGGSLSTILSDFVIEDLLDFSLARVKRPKLFIKYVDDCFLIAEPTLIPSIIDILNAQDKRIQFIPTFENLDGIVTYLNMSIKNTHSYDDLITSWYAKDIASGRLLNFHSSHPRSMIDNTAKCYITEMLKLTHVSLRSTIFNKAHRILLDNDFPEEFANRIIKLAATNASNSEIIIESSYQHQSDPYETEKMTTKENSIYMSLPYIQNITPNLNKEIRKMHSNYTITAKPISTMKQAYDSHKNLKPFSNNIK